MDVHDVHEAFAAECKRHIDVWPHTLNSAAIRLEMSLRARADYPDRAPFKQSLAEDFATFEAALITLSSKASSH